MSTGAAAGPCKRFGLGVNWDIPLLTLGQQVVEDTDKVQACSSDAGGEEDGSQAVSVHMSSTGQHIIPAADLLSKQLIFRRHPTELTFCALSSCLTRLQASLRLPEGTPSGESLDLRPGSQIRSWFMSWTTLKMASWIMLDRVQIFKSINYVNAKEPNMAWAVYTASLGTMNGRATVHSLPFVRIPCRCSLNSTSQTDLPTRDREVNDAP